MRNWNGEDKATPFPHHPDKGCPEVPGVEV